MILSGKPKTCDRFFIFLELISFFSISFLGTHHVAWTQTLVSNPTDQNLLSQQIHFINRLSTLWSGPCFSLRYHALINQGNVVSHFVDTISNQESTLTRLLTRCSQFESEIRGFLRHIRIDQSNSLTASEWTRAQEMVGLIETLDHDQQNYFNQLSGHSTESRVSRTEHGLIAGSIALGGLALVSGPLGVAAFGVGGLYSSLIGAYDLPLRAPDVAQEVINYSEPSILSTRYPPPAHLNVNTPPSLAQPQSQQTEPAVIPQRNQQHRHRRRSLTTRLIGEAQEASERTSLQRSSLLPPLHELIATLHRAFEDWRLGRPGVFPWRLAWEGILIHEKNLSPSESSALWAQHVQRFLDFWGQLSNRALPSQQSFYRSLRRADSLNHLGFLITPGVLHALTPIVEFQNWQMLNTLCERSHLLNSSETPESCIYEWAWSLRALISESRLNRPGSPLLFVDTDKTPHWLDPLHIRIKTTEAYTRLLTPRDLSLSSTWHPAHAPLYQGCLLLREKIESRRQTWNQEFPGLLESNAVTFQVYTPLETQEDRSHSSESEQAHNTRSNSLHGDIALVRPLAILKNQILAALQAWETSGVMPFNYPDLLFETEMAQRGESGWSRRLGHIQKRWRHKLNVISEKIRRESQRRTLTHEDQLILARNELIKDWIENYYRDSAYTTTALESPLEGTNCQGNTQILILALNALGIDPGDSKLYAVQQFSDHVQPILFFQGIPDVPSSRWAWSFLDGLFQGSSLRGAVYRQQILAWSKLKSLGINPPWPAEHFRLAVTNQGHVTDPSLTSLLSGMPGSLSWPTLPVPDQFAQGPVPLRVRIRASAVTDSLSHRPTLSPHHEGPSQGSDHSSELSSNILRINDGSEPVRVHQLPSLTATASDTFITISLPSDPSTHSAIQNTLQLLLQHLEDNPFNFVANSLIRAFLSNAPPPSHPLSRLASELKNLWIDTLNQAAYNPPEAARRILLRAFEESRSMIFKIIDDSFLQDWIDGPTFKSHLTEERWFRARTDAMSGLTNASTTILLQSIRDFEDQLHLREDLRRNAHQRTFQTQHPLWDLLTGPGPTRILSYAPLMTKKRILITSLLALNLLKEKRLHPRIPILSPHWDHLSFILDLKSYLHNQDSSQQPLPDNLINWSIAIARRAPPTLVFTPSDQEILNNPWNLSNQDLSQRNQAYSHLHHILNWTHYECSLLSHFLGYYEDIQTMNSSNASRTIDQFILETELTSAHGAEMCFTHVLRFFPSWQPLLNLSAQIREHPLAWLALLSQENREKTFLQMLFAIPRFPLIDPVPHSSENAPTPLRALLGSVLAQSRRIHWINTSREIRVLNSDTNSSAPSEPTVPTIETPVSTSTQPLELHYEDATANPNPNPSPIANASPDSNLRPESPLTDHTLSQSTPSHSREAPHQSLSNGEPSTTSHHPLHQQQRSPSDFIELQTSRRPWLWLAYGAEHFSYELEELLETGQETTDYQRLHPLTHLELNQIEALSLNSSLRAELFRREDLIGDYWLLQAAQQNQPSRESSVHNHTPTHRNLISNFIQWLQSSNQIDTINTENFMEALSAFISPHRPQEAFTAMRRYIYTNIAPRSIDIMERWSRDIQQLGQSIDLPTERCAHVSFGEYQVLEDNGHRNKLPSCAPFIPVNNPAYGTTNEPHHQN